MANGPDILELPELVIQLISEQLSYEDLRNLRVTCKTLKQIIDQRPFASLHLFVNAYPFERELLHTGEPIRYANTFHVRGLDILKSTKFKSQFIGLRKLTIYHQFPPRVWRIERLNLEDLNCFEQLIHLELKDLSVKGKLSLSNLKIAFLDGVTTNRNTIFQLDCPQLQVLGLGRRTHPELTDETGQSVQHLYVNFIEDNAAYLLDLYAQLSNLSTVCFRDSNNLNDFVLAVTERRVSLASLKGIQLKDCGEILEAMMRNLSNLKKRKQTKHIQVRMNGKMLRNDELVEMLDQLEQSFPPDLQDPQDPQDHSFYFAVLESNLLRSFDEKPILHCLLPAVSGLRIRLKEDLVISKRLINELRGLRSLMIEKDIELDEQLFERILKTCRKLEDLRIGCDSLTQQQLDRMPDYLQKLQFLAFGDDFKLDKFNLDFVTKFRNLAELELALNISKEAISFLLENCNHQPHFRLVFRGKQAVCIPGQRDEYGRFQIVCNNRAARDAGSSIKRKYFDSIEKAIEHYHRKDLFNARWDPTIKIVTYRCSLM